MEASSSAGGETPAGPASPETQPYLGARQAWWGAIVFFILYNLSFIDRQMINLLVEPIRDTLQISDFEISLLQGFTFAVFYCFLGVPIGWLVDNRPRRTIVAAGVVVWSLATAACGLATKFWHLAIARIGVATGEATLAPAAYSILGDAFPPNKLALPMSLMGTGAGLGGALAGVIAGAIVSVFPETGTVFPVVGKLLPWQVAFLVTALPGMLLAPLIYTVREPARRFIKAAKTGGRSAAMSFLKLHPRFYFGHFFGFAMFSLCNYGLTAWLATFFIRVHGFSLGEAAFAFGVLTLFATVTGGIAMGFAVDRWFGAGRQDAHLRFFAFVALGQMVCVVLATQLGDWRLMFAALVPAFILQSHTGIAAAAIAITTPTNVRGQISAIYLLVFNLIGLGLGPSMVAIFTDFVFQDDKMVGNSLALTFLIFAPLTALLLFSAMPGMRRALEMQTAPAS